MKGCFESKYWKIKLSGLLFPENGLLLWQNGGEKFANIGDFSNQNSRLFYRKGLLLTPPTFIYNAACPFILKRKRACKSCNFLRHEKPQSYGHSKALAQKCCKAVRKKHPRRYYMQVSRKTSYEQTKAEPIVTWLLCLSLAKVATILNFEKHFVRSIYDVLVLRAIFFHFGAVFHHGWFEFASWKTFLKMFWEMTATLFRWTFVWWVCVCQSNFIPCTGKLPS